MIIEWDRRRGGCFRNSLNFNVSLQRYRRRLQRSLIGTPLYGRDCVFPRIISIWSRREISRQKRRLVTARNARRATLDYSFSLFFPRSSLSSFSVNKSRGIKRQSKNVNLFRGIKLMLREYDGEKLRITYKAIRSDDERRRYKIG